MKKITDEANQQANMAAIDSHFMHMSSLKGLGSFHHHHRHIGSGQYHSGATRMRHYPSNMTLGRLNSLAGMFPNVSSSLPRNHSDGGGYILQGLPVPPLQQLQINNDKAFPSLTSQQSSLMASPNNLLLLNGQPQTSSLSLNPGYSPHFEINNRLDQWSNAALSTNIPQSDVHSKPDALEWNLLCDSETGSDFGSLDAAQTNCFETQMTEQPIKEGLFMGQQKQQSGFMASGSLNDIVNSVMTQV